MTGKPAISALLQNVEKSRRISGPALRMTRRGLPAFQYLHLLRDSGAQEAEIAADREKTEAAPGGRQRAFGIGAIKPGELSGFFRRGDDLVERGFDFARMRI